MLLVNGIFSGFPGHIFWLVVYSALILDDSRRPIGQFYFDCFLLGDAALASFPERPEYQDQKNTGCNQRLIIILDLSINSHRSSQDEFRLFAAGLLCNSRATIVNPEQSALFPPLLRESPGQLSQRKPIRLLTIDNCLHDIGGQGDHVGAAGVAHWHQSKYFMAPQP